MINKEDIKKIKEATGEFFEKMTMPVSIGEAGPSDKDDSVNLDIKADEPQILIGQGGQTLFEIQRILRLILNKKLGRIFYFNLDINDYKKQKIEYLKSLAKDLADQVTLNKETKVLPAMPAYERRIIHAELAQRTDITSESQGDGFSRHIVIKPK